ncbi:MAG: beta-N-acetylhexosaminidase [Pirellulales bacterium]|nr:beta-N-acetylhexosaminidase [Pirellulales bacterium]
MMKQRVFLWLLAASMTVLTATAFSADDPAGDGATAPSPAVIPQPVLLEKSAGKPFALNEGVALQSAGVPEKSLQIASEIIHKALGLKLKQVPSGEGTKIINSPLPLGEGQEVRADMPNNSPHPNPLPKGEGTKGKAITLRIDPSVGKGRPDWQAAESYQLTVSEPGGIEIAASDPHGLLNGVQTLVQLAEKGPGGTWQVPPVKIDDYPRFPWRGYLLDTVRHFRPKAEVLRYIDLLAMHKLNVLHMHLVDDQGWRLEIKRYPKLTEVGAALPNYSGGRGPGWFYSQDDMKEIIAYAADRFITVVPEIEMPGHSSAATASYPELGCQGKSTPHLCAGSDSTYQFMANVLDEVADLFPSPFIHIGGDEVWPDIWRACPVCKKRMAELLAAKLPSDVHPQQVNLHKPTGVPPNEDVSRLEGEFIRRIDKHLASKGKRMIGWDEILEGGLTDGSRAVAMAWRSPDAVTAAIKGNRDVIASIHPIHYLDVDCPLETTYTYEPVPDGLSEAQAKHVLGVQGNMWGESTPTQQRVDLRTFPRLIAIAERGWSPRKVQDFKDFDARLHRHAERLQPYGIVLFPAADQTSAPK